MTRTEDTQPKSQSARDQRRVVWAPLLFLLGLALGFIVLLGLAYWGSYLRAEVTSLEASRDELKRENSILNAAEAELQSKQEALQKQVIELEARAEAAEERVEGARANLDELERVLDARDLTLRDVKEYLSRIKRSLDSEGSSSSPRGAYVPIERLMELRNARPASRAILDELVRGTPAMRVWAWSNLDMVRKSPNWTAEEQSVSLESVLNMASLLVTSSKKGKELVDARNLRGQAEYLIARFAASDAREEMLRGALNDLDVAVKNTRFTQPHKDIIAAVKALHNLGASGFETRLDVANYVCDETRVRKDKYRSTNCAAEMMAAAVWLYKMGDRTSAESAACEAAALTYPETAADVTLARAAKIRRQDACEGRW